MTPRRIDDRGSATVELVIATPLLIALLLLVAGLGRYATARGQVDSAAREAARAASMERSPALASTAGSSAATSLLAGENVTCQQLAVSVDVAAFRPGGSVSATVRCTASLSGLGLSGLPGSRVFVATSVAPIEMYRSE